MDNGSKPSFSFTASFTPGGKAMLMADTFRRQNRMKLTVWPDESPFQDPYAWFDPEYGRTGACINALYGASR